MVGIVVVSHSQKLSEGVVEVAKMMAEDAPIAAGSPGDLILDVSGGSRDCL